MTELSFLLDLLLNEKLAKSVQLKIKERITYLEENKPVWPVQAGARQPIPVETMTVTPELQAKYPGQSPSTIAALEKHSQNAAAQVAVASPAAANALAQREQAIAEQLSGKPQPGRTSPRKF